MSIHFSQDPSQEGRIDKVLAEGTAYAYLKSSQFVVEVQFAVTLKDSKRRLILYRQMGYGPRFKYSKEYFEFN